MPSPDITPEKRRQQANSNITKQVVDALPVHNGILQVKKDFFVPTSRIAPQLSGIDSGHSNKIDPQRNTEISLHHSPARTFSDGTQIEASSLVQVKVPLTITKTPSGSLPEQMIALSLSIQGDQSTYTTDLFSGDTRVMSITENSERIRGNTFHEGEHAGHAENMDALLGVVLKENKDHFLNSPTPSQAA